MQKSPAISVPASANSGLSVPALLPYALWALLAAGLGELLLYRTLSRVGVHIPKKGAVLDAYDALVRLGSFAFDVSSVLVFVALGLLAYTAARRWDGRTALAAVTPALIATVGVVSLLLSFWDEGPTARFAYGVLSAGAMLALAAQAWVQRGREPLRAAVVGLVVLAYLAAQYQVLAHQAYQALELSALPPTTTTLLELAELLVVANAFVVFWAWSGVREGTRWRPSRLQLATVGLLAVLFLGSYYGGEDSSTPAILSLWTLGLTLYLPLPLYALALGLYGAALAHALHGGLRGKAPIADGIALALLLVGGLTLETTYQHMVALVALLLLVLPAGAEDSAPQRMAAPSPTP